MRVTFDSAKSERNEVLRGLSFALAKDFDWSCALVVEDTREDYAKRDEPAPEWFAKARPASEVLGGLFGPATSAEMLKPRRGRPTLLAPKEHVNIRLDADIVGAFKATGSGWQTRMNNALRDWLKTHQKLSEPA